MHLLLCATEDVPHLEAELERSCPLARVEMPVAGLLVAKLPSSGGHEVPPLVFHRQCLPEALWVCSPSIRGWVDILWDALVPALSETKPWRLHVWPHFGLPHPGAGRHRCELVRREILERLRKGRRQLLRRLEDTSAPFREGDSLVQLVLTSPDRGFLSVTSAPELWRQRHLISPFPGGQISVAVDKAAPSRAFAKLVEAEARLGVSIRDGETCVDLGASPGSWSYVASRRGAQVIAVDRSPLRDDLMRDPRLRFERGDAFAYNPRECVDWLLCDVIAAPERSIGLLTDWLARAWCRRFVVTVKFKGSGDYSRLDALKELLPEKCDRWLLTRLCANRNEACAAGVVRQV